MHVHFRAAGLPYHTSIAGSRTIRQVCWLFRCSLRKWASSIDHHCFFFYTRLPTPQMVRRRGSIPSRASQPPKYHRFVEHTIRTQRILSFRERVPLYDNALENTDHLGARQRIVHLFQRTLRYGQRCWKNNPLCGAKCGVSPSASNSTPHYIHGESNWIRPVASMAKYSTAYAPYSVKVVK